MESEALRTSFKSITVFPAMPVPLDGNKFKFLFPGFVAALGGKVGGKPKRKISMALLYI